MWQRIANSTIKDFHDYFYCWVINPNEMEEMQMLPMEESVTTHNRRADNGGNYPSSKSCRRATVNGIATSHEPSKSFVTELPHDIGIKMSKL